MELIPSGDEPRNKPFYISVIRWLIIIHGQIKHHWVPLQCETGQTSLTPPDWNGWEAESHSLSSPKISYWCSWAKKYVTEFKTEQRRVWPSKDACILYGFIYSPHLVPWSEPITSCPREQKSVFSVCKFIIFCDSRRQLTGETHERNHSWVWMVRETATHHLCSSTTHRNSPLPLCPRWLCILVKNRIVHLQGSNGREQTSNELFMHCTTQ